MELSQIVQRVAEGIPQVDKITETIRFTRRYPKVQLLPGVKTLLEEQFVVELMDWWSHAYPNDGDSLFGGFSFEIERGYKRYPRAKCDLVLSSDGSGLVEPEWAIEFKHISLAGNNGKANGYAVQKVLSPYLNDRSLIHDIERLKADPPGRKLAVIGYCFDYSFETCVEALSRHPRQKSVVDELTKLCRGVDPVNGVFSVTDLVEFADDIFQKRGLVSAPVQNRFNGAWKHPAGGNGLVFGWQVI
jgi:hypothetical protein